MSSHAALQQQLSDSSLGSQQIPLEVIVLLALSGTNSALTQHDISLQVNLRGNTVSHRKVGNKGKEK